MGQYLIDNNVISHFLSRQFSPESMEFIGEIIDNTPNISIITKIESLAWVTSDKNKERIIADFVEYSNIFELTPPIVNLCIKIKRNRKIKTPDAIIAATAICNNLTLITSDKDFTNISDLKVLNPNRIDVNDKD